MSDLPPSLANVPVVPSNSPAVTGRRTSTGQHRVEVPADVGLGSGAFTPPYVPGAWLQPRREAFAPAVTTAVATAEGVGTVRHVVQGRRHSVEAPAELGLGSGIYTAQYVPSSNSKPSTGVMHGGTTQLTPDHQPCVAYSEPSYQCSSADLTAYQFPSAAPEAFWAVYQQNNSPPRSAPSIASATGPFATPSLPTPSPVAPMLQKATPTAMGSSQYFGSLQSSNQGKSGPHCLVNAPADFGLGAGAYTSYFVPGAFPISQPTNSGGPLQASLTAAPGLRPNTAAPHQIVPAPRDLGMGSTLSCTPYATGAQLQQPPSLAPMGGPIYCTPPSNVYSYSNTPYQWTSSVQSSGYIAGDGCHAWNPYSSSGPATPQLTAHGVPWVPMR